MGVLKKSQNIFWEITTLSTPRARVVVFSLFLIFLALFPTQYLGEKGGHCIFHSFLFPLILKQSYYCLGCGLTHAVSRVMHGDFLGAYYYSKMIILVFPLILVILISDIIKLAQISKSGSTLRIK